MRRIASAAPWSRTLAHPPGSALREFQSLETMAHPFLTEWAAWQPNTVPYVFPGDEVLLSPRARQAIVTHSSPKKYIASECFNTPDDTKLHLGLHPMPILGDLARAKVVFLLLNPGLRPGDYFAESDHQDYWTALRRSTQQKLKGVEYPFLFLDPSFSWHSGFLWWTRKLAPIIREVLAKRRASPQDALRTLSQSVANIELYPYHSRRFCLPAHVRRQLRSVELARSFVTEVLLPKARSGKVLLVVMRRKRDWGLSTRKRRGVLSFNVSEARGAHLSTNTKIGRAVLERLGLS